MAGFIWRILLVSLIADQLTARGAFTNQSNPLQLNKDAFQTFLSSHNVNQNYLRPPSIGVKQRILLDRSFIEQLLEVRCTSQQMIILLHYKPRLKPEAAENVKRGHFYARHTVTACPQLDARVEEEAFSLSVGYDNCNIQKEQKSNSIVYTGLVHFETSGISQDVANANTGINQTYEVQCSHPLAQETEKTSFSLALSKDRHSTTYWTYPYIVVDNSYAYLTIKTNLSLTWNQNQNIHGYPIDCWITSKNADTKSDTESGLQVKQFLKNGCPYNGLSTLHHFTDGPTKVGVNISKVLSNKDTTSANLNDFINITFSCTVIPCIQSTISGLLNIPKCPSSHFCSARTNVFLPAQLRGVRKSEVNAGPIIFGINTKRQEITSTTIDCSLKCRSISPLPVVIEDKITFHSTLVIAFISFVFGIFVMGTLWWVHIQTDPERLLKANCASKQRTSNTSTLINDNVTLSRNTKHQLRSQTTTGAAWHC